MLVPTIALMALWPGVQVWASLENPARSPTPPMGFNDWARFECAINQTLFVDTADAMVSKGLLSAGYNRVHIDDCWPLHHRLANGSLMWNSEIFPKGLIWLGQYLKQKGFHFGIYSDAGNETCGGWPGSLGHEEQDAETFVSWGIDYLKLDGCNVYNAPGKSLEETYQGIYQSWHQVLKGSKTPLVFSESAPAYFAGAQSLTDWYEVMDWVPLYGELARHSYDIATYNSTTDPWASVMTNYDQEVRLAREQGPGYHNDPDFLITDDPHLKLEEKRSHFALWSSLSAPLIISAYIPGLPDEVIEYLTNEDFIAVDQDALSLQATLVSHDGTIDVLTKSLANGDRLVTILNNGSSTRTVEVPLARIGWSPPPSSYGKQSTKLMVKNLWNHQTSALNPSSTNAAIKATVPSHGTAAYRISVQNEPSGYGTAPSDWVPTGIIFNTDSFHCLTLKKGKLSWTDCDSSDSQVWHVGKNGSTIKPLSNPSSKCLVASDSKGAFGRCQGVNWHYGRMGNVVKAGTKQCLTEGTGGAVVVQNCGFLRDNQVFELPSGWQL